MYMRRTILLHDGTYNSTDNSLIDEHGYNISFRKHKCYGMFRQKYTFSF